MKKLFNMDRFVKDMRTTAKVKLIKDIKQMEKETHKELTAKEIVGLFDKRHCLKLEEIKEEPVAPVDKKAKKVDSILNKLEELVEEKDKVTDTTKIDRAIKSLNDEITKDKRRGKIKQEKSKKETKDESKKESNKKETIRDKNKGAKNNKELKALAEKVNKLLDPNTPDEELCKILQVKELTCKEDVGKALSKNPALSEAMALEIARREAEAKKKKSEPNEPQRYTRQNKTYEKEMTLDEVVNNLVDMAYGDGLILNQETTSDGCVMYDSWEDFATVNNLSNDIDHEAWTEESSDEGKVKQCSTGLI